MSADPIKFIKIAQVVQEKLGERDAEQRHAGITRRALLDFHADEDKREGEERPRD